MEFPKEFKKCPHCGATGTLYLDACENEPSAPKNKFAYLEKKLSPIQDFLSISTPTTRVLMRHFDTCSVCGSDYCVRAEKLPMPTEILMQAMGIAINIPQGK